MAISETVEININSSQAVASLRSIERNLDLLTNGFREFMTGVAEGMTSALGKTNQTTAGLDRMRKSVDDLNKSVDKTDVARKLGTDVGKTSRSVSELSSRLSQTGRQLIGLESIIGAFAISNLVRGASDYARETASVSSSSAAAVQAQTKLSQSVDNFYQALLNISEPLNKMISGVNISVQAFEKFLNILKEFGTYALIIGVTILGGKLILALRAAYATATAMAGSISTASSALVNFIRIMREPLFRSALFQSLKELSGGWIKRIAVLISELIPGLGALGASLAANWRAWTIWGAAVATAVAAAYDKVKEFFGFKPKEQKVTISGPEVPGRFAMTAKENAQYLKSLDEWETKRANIRARLGNQISDDLQNFQRQNQAIQQQLQLETRLTGQSQDMIDIARIRQQFEQQRLQTVTELQRKIRDLGAEETAAGGVQMIQDQIASYNKLSKAAEEAQIAQIRRLQAAQLIERDRLANLERMNDAYERQKNLAQTLASVNQTVVQRQQDLNFERSLMGKGGFERDLLTARRALSQLYTEQSQAIAEAFSVEGEIVDTQGYAAAIARLAEQFRQLSVTTDNNAAAARRWSTGWNEAVENFADDAYNAADRARTMFNGIISSMESALDNFVRTGKLNFKDLVRSIIADLTSMALKNAFRQLLLASNIGKGGSLLATLGSFFAGFFADGGFIPPGKAGIVGEAGPELVSGPARVTPMSAMPAGPNIVNNYYISALDAKSVAQLFAENRRTLLGVTEQARKEMPIRQRF